MPHRKKRKRKRKKENLLVPMKLFNLIVWFSLALSLIACDSNRIFDENRDFKNETWLRDSTLVFNVHITDTLAVYHVFLNNRITTKYEFSNLYLFIDTELPNKQLLRDTVECLLREPNGNPLGKPLGTGFGNVWSNKIPYRKNIRFPMSGNYNFTIEQAMRVDTLKHILNAGIRIEKAKI
jgi:gliding motility-associated lipoprotein GldH